MGSRGISDYNGVERNRNKAGQWTPSIRRKPKYLSKNVWEHETFGKRQTRKDYFFSFFV